METIRLLYPDWYVVGTICFILLLAIIATCVIVATIKFIQYISAALKSEPNAIFYIEDLDGDNLINVDEIEQVNKRWDVKNESYEIVFYLKSGHEIKEEFDNPEDCNTRFKDIKIILNDFYC